MSYGQGLGRGHLKKGNFTYSKVTSGSRRSFVISNIEAVSELRFDRPKSFDHAPPILLKPLRWSSQKCT